ncbi:MAG: rod shape-determining protein MreD [Candidatus Rokubacteria bacterium]|nr:rod shape-determining protein MreD [Candidatus Rokubacteria bacterium]
MRLPLYFLAIGGGTLVQSTVVPVLGIGGVVPDLPVVLVVLLALRRGPEVGCVMGFALGLAQDAIVGGPLGLQALSKAVVGFIAGELPRWCWVANPVVPITVAILATVADGVLRFALLQLFHYPAAFSELFGSVILPQAGYNGLLAAAALGLPVFRARP